MHDIYLPITLNQTSEKAYIAAIASAMYVDLPNKIKLTTPENVTTYSITSYKVTGVKKLKPEE